MGKEYWKPKRSHLWFCPDLVKCSVVACTLMPCKLRSPKVGIGVPWTSCALASTTTLLESSPCTIAWRKQPMSSKLWGKQRGVITNCSWIPHRLHCTRQSKRFQSAVGLFRGIFSFLLDMAMNLRGKCTWNPLTLILLRLMFVWMVFAQTWPMGLYSFAFWTVARFTSPRQSKPHGWYWWIRLLCLLSGSFYGASFVWGGRFEKNISI